MDETDSKLRIRQISGKASLYSPYKSKLTKKRYEKKTEFQLKISK